MIPPTRPFCAFTIIVCMAATTLPAQAHHSAAQYDGQKRVSYTGTVYKYEWQNPHVWIWLMLPQVGDAPAQKVGIECAAPQALKLGGLTWNSIKVGDQLTATAAPLRDGQAGGLLVGLQWADGRKWDSPFKSVLQDPGTKAPAAP